MHALTRRVQALETKAGPNTDVARMTDAELTAELIAINRRIVADPEALPDLRVVPAAWLALPWHIPAFQWTDAQRDEERQLVLLRL